MRFVSSQSFFALAFALSATSVSAATHVIIVGANGTLTFSPATLTIPPGDTITFQQDDATFAHNAVSDDGTTFSTGATRFGPWNSVTAPLAAGSYPFHCTNHGAAGGVGMSGTITVQTTPVRLQRFEVE